MDRAHKGIHARGEDRDVDGELRTPFDLGAPAAAVINFLLDAILDGIRGNLLHAVDVDWRDVGCHGGGLKKIPDKSIVAIDIVGQRGIIQPVS